MKINTLSLLLLTTIACQNEHQNTSGSENEHRSTKSSHAQGNEVGFGGYGLLKNDEIELLDLVLNSTTEVEVNAQHQPGRSELSEAGHSEALLRALNIDPKKTKINLDFLRVFSLKLEELDSLYNHSMIDIDRKLVGSRQTTRFSHLLLSAMFEDFRWIFTDQDIAAAHDFNPQLKEKIEEHLGIKISNERLVPLAYRSSNKIVLSSSRFNQLKDANHRAALIYHEAFSSMSELIARRNGKSIHKQKVTISLQAADLVSYIFSKDLENKGAKGFLNHFWLKLMGEDLDSHLINRDKKLQSFRGRMLHLETGNGFDLRLHSAVIPFEIALPSKVGDSSTSINSVGAAVSQLPKKDPCKQIGLKWFLPQDSLVERIVLHKYFDLRPRNFEDRARFSFSPFLLIKSQEDGSDYEAVFEKLIRVEDHWSAMLFNSSHLNLIALHTRGSSIRMDIPHSDGASRASRMDAHRSFAIMCARFEPTNGLPSIKDTQSRKWKYLGEFKGSDVSIDRCRAMMGKSWRLPTPEEYQETKYLLSRNWSSEESKIDWGTGSEIVALRSKESLSKSIENIHEMYAAMGSYVNRYEIVKNASKGKLPSVYSRQSDGSFRAHESEESKKHAPKMLHICIQPKP